MSKFKGTKGNLEVKKIDGRITDIVAINDDNKWPICTVQMYLNNRTVKVMSHDDFESYSKLFAASPELLEALDTIDYMITEKEKRGKKLSSLELEIRETALDAIIKVLKN